MLSARSRRDGETRSGRRRRGDFLSHFLRLSALLINIQLDRSYHTTAIDSINSTVRRYNVVAPYTARRGLHSVNAEVAACVKACIPAITWELQRRMDGERVKEMPEKNQGEPGEQAEEEIVEQKAVNDRFWPALRRGVFDLLGIKTEATK